LLAEQQFDHSVQSGVAWYGVVCADLNGSATDKPESNGKKQTATYLNPGTLQLGLLQLVVSVLKLEVVALEVHSTNTWQH
jgi:hypothetical protein